MEAVEAAVAEAEEAPLAVAVHCCCRCCPTQAYSMQGTPSWPPPLHRACRTLHYRLDHIPPPSPPSAVDRWLPDGPHRTTDPQRPSARSGHAPLRSQSPCSKHARRLLALPQAGKDPWSCRHPSARSYPTWTSGTASGRTGGGVRPCSSLDGETGGFGRGSGGSSSLSTRATAHQPPRSPRGRRGRQEVSAERSRPTLVRWHPTRHVDR